MCKHPKVGWNTHQTGNSDYLRPIHNPLNWSQPVLFAKQVKANIFGPVANFSGPVNGTGTGGWEMLG